MSQIISCDHPQTLEKRENAVLDGNIAIEQTPKVSLIRKEGKMDIGKAISRLHQIYVYNKTVRLDEAIKPQTIAREKLITMIIIQILPLFAEHLCFSKYML